MAVAVRIRVETRCKQRLGNVEATHGDIQAEKQNHYTRQAQ